MRREPRTILAHCTLTSLPHHHSPPPTPHTQSSDRNRKFRFLPDVEYGIALDNLVKGCTDVLLAHPDGKRVFVGKRRVQPQPDWWFMGGRMFPGETPIDSCVRLLKRELDLDVERSRFVPICAQAFAFGMREQMPKEHGTTDVQLCYLLRLRDETEASGVILDPGEYSEGTWKSPAEILDGRYHPALKYAIGSMLAMEALEDVERCEGLGGTDEELARLTRVFLSRKRAVDGMIKGGATYDYVLDSRELDYRATVQSKY
ncbi:hypothetical protein ACHAXA_005842 [Cyclostephanos tholiformis]|uniref:Nudix hydrolase domain-containing protein n=1 Tax=Cyclostephanos tholiformis TaxID=382380 RepID=A0ABD3RWB7_9STRA